MICIHKCYCTHSYNFESSVSVMGRPSWFVRRRNDCSLCWFARVASIDTTSTVTAWNLVQSVVRPGAQEKVYAEIHNNRDKGITEDKIAE
jgi:hypothetical protein